MRSWFKKSIQKMIHVVATDIEEQIAATRFSHQIAPLFTNWAYLPLTDWAAGPEFICHISNEICINNRRSIVEFGSGVTTIMLARLAKTNSIDLKITTIDQSQEWQGIVKQIAVHDGVDQYINFVHNPIKHGIYGNIAEIQQRIFIKEDRFDCVIVDGPASGHEFTRLESLPIVRDYLCNSFVIFLHDTDRNEEKLLAADWAKRLPNVDLASFSRYAVLSSQGPVFDCAPQRQV